MIDKSFRILIVDNEPNIAKGIHELINILEKNKFKPILSYVMGMNVPLNRDFRGMVFAILKYQGV